MAEAGHTAGEYIVHHLQNLTVCRADGEWVWNQCNGNFYALNVDSMFFAVLLGLVFLTLFGRVAKRATTGVPGKLQTLVEIVVGFVDQSGGRFDGTAKLLCEITLRDGKVVYDLNGMTAVPWEKVPPAAGGRGRGQAGTDTAAPRKNAK